MNKIDGCIEERDNYTLLEKNGKKITVRDLQLEVLTIMDEIHRVCEKNNIRYALMAGSALGIVNYKGFIPWDDDIDVCMPREDYDRLLTLSDEFRSPYFCRHLILTKIVLILLQSSEIVILHRQVRILFFRILIMVF